MKMINKDYYHQKKIIYQFENNKLYNNNNIKNYFNFF